MLISERVISIEVIEMLLSDIIKNGGKRRSKARATKKIGYSNRKKP